MKKSLRGFTLLELLVVIVIIAILVGMIFPVLMQARQMAMSGKCKGNLKMLHSATMSYCYSHGGALPYSATSETWAISNDVLSVGWIFWGPTNTLAKYSPPMMSGALLVGGSVSAGGPAYSYVKWWGQDGIDAIKGGTIWPYAQSLKMYSCPSFESMATSKDPLNVLFSKSNAIVRAYSMNCLVSGASLSSISPSRTLLFADMAEGTAIGGTTISEKSCLQAGSNEKDSWYWDGELSGTNGVSRTYPVESVGICHGGKANAIFVDGHVEPISWNQTTNACAGNW